jgi:hypothetical protein
VSRLRSLGAFAADGVTVSVVLRGSKDCGPELPQLKPPEQTVRWLHPPFGSWSNSSQFDPLANSSTQALSRGGGELVDGYSLSPHINRCQSPLI